MTHDTSLCLAWNRARERGNKGGGERGEREEGRGEREEGREGRGGTREEGREGRGRRGLGPGIEGFLQPVLGNRQEVVGVVFWPIAQ